MWKDEQTSDVMENFSSILWRSNRKISFHCCTKNNIFYNALIAAQAILQLILHPEFSIQYQPLLTLIFCIASCIWCSWCWDDSASKRMSVSFLSFITSSSRSLVTTSDSLLSLAKKREKHSVRSYSMCCNNTLVVFWEKNSLNGGNTRRM